MLALRAYQVLTFLAWPLFWVLLLRRRWRGKEQAYRIRERRGVATKTPSLGPLIWFHGASVGESLSILPLANHLLDQFPDAELLLTSGTLASASLLANRLPERAQHQFVPFDHPLWVDRFLGTWRPTVAIWVESEIWPNLLRGCQVRGIPLYLVNARLSNRSLTQWRKLPRLAQRLFAAFDLVIAQSREEAARFTELGAPTAVDGGNIKFAGEMLPASDTEVAAWRAAFLSRPTWFAVSTHFGEEALVLEVHERLKARHPSLITLLAPRHLERIPALQTELLSGRPYALYSEGPDMIAGHSLLLIDKMGVLGPIYQTCGVALVAGSLVPGIGGHNPIEPARNGAAVLVGQHMENQRDVVALFSQADALVQISDVNSLIDAVDSLLSDGERRRELQARGRALVDSQGEVLRLYSSALVPRIRGALA